MIAPTSIREEITLTSVHRILFKCDCVFIIYLLIGIIYATMVEYQDGRFFHAIVNDDTDYWTRKRWIVDKRILHTFVSLLSSLSSISASSPSSPSSPLLLYQRKILFQSFPLTILLWRNLQGVS